MAGDGERVRAGTGSLRKAMRLIAELGAADAEGLRLTELVSRTDMDSSTAFRMLGCLVEEGFLQKVEGKRYRLGPMVFELGLAAGQHFNLHMLARKTLHTLATTLGTTAMLNVRSGIETVYLERADGPEQFSGLRAAVGTRHPIGVGAGGVALLAAMPPSQADALIRANERRYRAFGRNTSQVLRRRLDRAKADGYASTVSFLRPDVGSIGMVVPGATAEPRLAVSLICTTARLAERDTMVSLLRAAAQEMARAIAARPN